MTRLLKVTVLGALLLTVAGAGLAQANPRGGGGRGGFMHHMVTSKIEEALAAARATAAQKSAVLAQAEKVFAAVASSHAGPGPQMDRALALFEADRVDQDEVNKIRAEHLSRMQVVGDVLVEALRESHAALTSTQRQLIAGYVRENFPGAGKHAARREMMEAKFAKHIDEALDAAQPTAQQRAAIDAARDHARTAMKGKHQHREQLEEVLAIFTAETWDAGKVAALRGRHQAGLAQAGDTLVQALFDVHDVLTAPQRKAVANYVRSHRQHHGGHGPG